MLIHLEELWLSVQRHLEVVNGFYAVLLRLCEIQLQYSVLFHKYKCSILCLPRWKCFKVKLRAHFIENSYVFDSNSVNLLELVSSFVALSCPFLENEQLVRFLLLHNEILTTDASDIAIVN